MSKCITDLGTFVPQSYSVENKKISNAKVELQINYTKLYVRSRLVIECNTNADFVNRLPYTKKGSLPEGCR